MQLEIDHLWSVGSWRIVCLGGSMEWHCIEETHPIGNSKLTKYRRSKSSGWLVYDLDRLELTVIAGQFDLLCREAYWKVSKQTSMEASN